MEFQRIECAMTIPMNFKPQARDFILQTTGM